MSVDAPHRATADPDEVTQEIRVTRRALREAAATPPSRAAAPVRVPVLPRRVPALPRRVPDPSAGDATWSRRTVVVLASLAVATTVLGGALLARTATAQSLRAEGHDAVAALTAALETARTDVAAAADAVTAARPAAGHARALADLLAPRAADLSPESVTAVATAADRLDALLADADAAADPTLPRALDDLTGLPARYVAARGDELAALRSLVDRELTRLGGAGAEATRRSGELTDAVAAASAAAALAAQAAGPAAATTLAAPPEASADARARLEAAVAALAAFGDAPAVDVATTQAFTAYLSAADAVRRAHTDAVTAREAAERLAAEEAAAAAEAAAAEAAREAERDERPWWRLWEGWGGDDRGRGRD